MIKSRKILIWILVWAIWASALALAAAQPKYDPELEAKIGKQAVAEVEKEMKVADDPQAVARISRIAQEIAQVTPRPKVEYKCKVVEGKQINAFSLPGGYIYVTQGLLKAVESEDELAGVIAHEIAHNCYWHAMDMLKQEKKLDQFLTPVLVAAILSGSESADASQVLIMGQLVKIGVINGYSEKAEFEADRAGIEYLAKSHYNPVGLLTVVEGLAQMENRRPRPELGIAQTHPWAEKRARAIIEQLKAMGIPINRRLVLKLIQTRAEAVKVGEAEIAQMIFGDQVIFQPAISHQGSTPLQRAQQAAGNLNELLKANLQIFELRSIAKADQTIVLARQQPIIVIYPGDAEFHGSTMAELAAQALASLKAVLWKEQVDRSY